MEGCKGRKEDTERRRGVGEGLDGGGGSEKGGTATVPATLGERGLNEHKEEKEEVLWVWQNEGFLFPPFPPHQPLPPPLGEEEERWKEREEERRTDQTEGKGDKERK